MVDPFIHALYVKHYVNKKPRRVLEVCIRCGSKGVLGRRKPFEGLCKSCRKEEFQKQFN